MALTDEIVGKTWDRAFASGHKCGWMDAVGEIWLYMKDIPTTDPHWSALMDLNEFLRARRDSVLAHADDPPAPE